MIKSLREFLAGQPAGPIQETSQLALLLTNCWQDLQDISRQDMRMTPQKLANRIEKAAWQPPILSFVIERHGGTVQGSTRAELQTWKIDLLQGTKNGQVSGHRQLKPMAQRIDIRSLAKDVANAIRSGSDLPGLKWLVAHARVRVLISEILPSEAVFKQTLASRRKRFRAMLEEEIKPEGWISKPAWVYERTLPAE